MLSSRGAYTAHFAFMMKTTDQVKMHNVVVFVFNMAARARGAARTKVEDGCLYMNIYTAYFIHSKSGLICPIRPLNSFPPPPPPPPCFLREDVLFSPPSNYRRSGQMQHSFDQFWRMSPTRPPENMNTACSVTRDPAIGHRVWALFGLSSSGLCWCR